MTNDWTDKEFKSAYFKDYNSKYYAEKRELLATKVTCQSCGKSVNLSSFKKHLKSNYHQKHSLPEDEQAKLFREKIVNLSKA
jgi:hypothetical protein